MKALGNRRGCLGSALVLLVVLLCATGAFGSSGRAELAFNSTGHCVGDSWKLAVTALGSPNTELRLQGISNGKEWEIPFTTDDGGYFNLSGVFGTDAKGKHSLHAVDGYGATPDVHFEVTKCPDRIDFSMADHGGVSVRSAGTLGAAVIGYAAIQPDRSATPSGLAILGLRQNNVLVSETSVPASGLIESGRIYAEVNGAVNTGLAIANPGNEPAIVSFFFTDSNGDFGGGSTTIPANGQIAAFLNQSPFNGPSLMDGSFTLNSSAPVAVFALRGLINERSEFLTTTLPVADLHVPPTQGTAVLPHFAEGMGWATEIVLVNPTDTILYGRVEFRDQLGELTPVILKDQPPALFPATVMRYAIPARSSQKLRTSGETTSVVTGSVHLVPELDTPTPAGVAVLSLRNEGMTFAEAGIPSVPAGSAFRLYAETAGDFVHGALGSIDTALAVANNASAPANVAFDVRSLDGSSMGLSGTLSIPGNGQAAIFLRQIPGFESLPAEFQGVVRVSSEGSLSVVGVRCRYNERSDLLVTVMPAVHEATTPSTAPLYFPHIVDSGGYTTQFVLFTGQSGSASSGTIRLFSQGGGALTLELE